MRNNPNIINGLKLLEQLGVMKDIEGSVKGIGKSYEQIVQDMSMMDINKKDLYFQGVSWENIDLFSGDVTALIPYYAIKMKEWQDLNKGQLVVTNILNKVVLTPTLRNVILEEVYKEG